MNLNNIYSERRAEIAADEVIRALEAGHSLRRVIELAMDRGGSPACNAALSLIHDQLKD
jgi:hypothetical protein